MIGFTELLRQLDNLDLPKDQYAIFGSGPLVIRGILDSNDLDVFVKPELWDELIKRYPVKKKFCETIEIGDIEITKDLSPWFDDASRFIDDSEEIKGHMFVKLKHIIDFKKKMNREKDKRHIELINEYLKDKKG